MKRKITSSKELSKALRIPQGRANEALMKAQLISAILKVVQEDSWTHAELAEKSKIPRSAVTGILSGSLQKITLDRLVRLADAAGLTTQLLIKKAS